MLESGDFELMKPLFDMYCGFVPMYEYRVKKYFGDSFEGCYFPECIYFWGDVFPESYGLEPWNSPILQIYRRRNVSEREGDSDGDVGRQIFQFVL